VEKNGLAGRKSIRQFAILSLLSSRFHLDV